MLKIKSFVKPHFSIQYNCNSLFLLTYENTWVDHSGYDNFVSISIY